MLFAHLVVHFLQQLQCPLYHLPKFQAKHQQRRPRNLQVKAHRRLPQKILQNRQLRTQRRHQQNGAICFIPEHQILTQSEFESESGVSE